MLDNSEEFINDVFLTQMNTNLEYYCTCGIFSKDESRHKFSGGCKKQRKQTA